MPNDKQLTFRRLKHVRYAQRLNRRASHIFVSNVPRIARRLK